MCIKFICLPLSFMKTTAIELARYGKAKNAFQNTEIEVLPPKEGEVQIEVECFGINYADVMARLGLYREAPPIPCVLGYEVVGKVIHVGSSLDNHLLGRRVVAFTRFGGYSQRVNTKTIGVVEIGDYDGYKAVSLATQYVTAFYMANVVTAIHEGDNILIHAAAGGVGTALIQLLKDKNVNIIAKIGDDNKREYLNSLGVKNIINYKTGDYIEQLKSILGKQKIDISFNPVGGRSFKRDWNVIGPTGTIILFGGSERSGKKWGFLSDLNFVRKMGVIIPITLMGSSRGIIGVNMLRVAEDKPKVLQKCLKSVVELAMKGKLNPQINKVFESSEIVDAHNLLESGESTGKIVIKW